MGSMIVCGSRDWDDADIVTLLLYSYLPDHVLHGDCPTGADALAAAALAEGNILDAEFGIEPVVVEAFPANWEAHGKAAGPIRNAEMLTRLKGLPQPHLVLAFRKGIESRGTDDMIFKARAAGIDTLVYHRT